MKNPNFGGSFMKLQKLRSLFLNGNGLTELPSDFGSLKALKDGKFYRWGCLGDVVFGGWKGWTKWWQLKDFLFWPRSLGFHDPIWRAYFWGWVVQPPTSEGCHFFVCFWFSEIIERNVRHESWDFQAKVQQKAPWSLQNIFFFDFLVSVWTYILCQITCGDKFPCEFCWPPRSFILKITSCDRCPRVLEIWRSCESWASREIRTSAWWTNQIELCWVGTVIFLDSLGFGKKSHKKSLIL